MDNSLPAIAAQSETCCGCGACAAVCPRCCITMAPDSLGFVHPSVDIATCVMCGSCERVCPAVANLREDALESVMWARSCDDDLVLSSSSGGIFGTLARSVIADGGVVVGAAWDVDCRSLAHVVVESEEGMDDILRSKYVQSSVGRDVYEAVRDSLRSGKRVLFCGTACQVAGMRLYLGQLAVSDRLLLVDVICHGVPSPLLWQRWIEWKERRHRSGVANVNFRCKETGWVSFSVLYEYETWESVGYRRDLHSFKKDWYMRAFLANASLRGSCLSCPAKRRCGSDITLGDYWGVGRVHPEALDERGVSAVVCNTEKGARALSSVLASLEWGESSFDDVLASNPALTRSVGAYPERDEFLLAVASGASIPRIMHRWPFEPGVVKRLLRRLRKLIRKALKAIS